MPQVKDYWKKDSQRVLLLFPPITATAMKEAFFYFFLFLLIIALIMFRSLYLQPFQKNPDLTGKSMQDFSIIAHRGASAYAPENTMASFIKATNMGADVVELDVHLSKDGEVVVIHDATLDRTTDGYGPVHLRTFQELRQLDAGEWFGPEFKGQAIPSLSEVLDSLAGKVSLLIELKTGKEEEKTFVYEGMARRVVDTLRAHNAFSWCKLQSFEESYLKEIVSLYPQAEVYQLALTDFSPFPLYFDNSLKTGLLPADSTFAAINPYFKSLTKGKVQNWQAQGLKVMPYTVNKREDMLMLIGYGVDGIITDYPDVLAGIRLELRKDYRNL